MSTDYAPEINLKIAQELRAPGVDLIPLPDITSSGKALLDAYMRSDGIVTMYELIKLDRNFLTYSPTGLKHVPLSLENNLGPLTEALGIPADLKFKLVSGLGFVASTKSELSRLTKEESTVFCLDQVMSKVRDEVRMDFQVGALDTTNWEVLMGDNWVLYNTDISFGESASKGRKARGISIFESSDLPTSVVAILQSEWQIEVLRSFIRNQGYVDRHTSNATDRPLALLHDIVGQVNKCFQPELGRDLITYLGDKVKGFRIEGEVKTKINPTGIHGDSLDMNEPIELTPDRKIPLEIAPENLRSIDVDESIKQRQNELISNMNLTPAEQALFELWIESENGEMTNNKLSQKAPYITRFKPSTFTAIAIKLREKLQPVAEALGIPSDITFIGIQGIGFVAGREEEFSKLSQRERYAGFVDLIIDKTKYEVKRDYKKLDKSGWETVQVGNSTLHFTDIKIGRHNESSPTRGIAILKDFDHKEPIVAVLRHPQVISTLRALIQHHGYIDEFISASSGGSANVHKTIRQINEYFRPELGKDLIEMVGNDLRGYAIEGDFRARMKLIADWMHLEKLDLERLLMEMPTGKIAMQKVVPYFKDHSTTVELAESRDLSDIDTSLMILHTESMKRTLRLKKSFEEVADRPFTLIVETLLDKKRSDISRAKRIALEISEAEAVTLLIFRESSEINLVELGFSYKQREAIKKRFRKFLDRLDRLDVESQGGLCEDSILRLPKFIL